MQINNYTYINTTPHTICLRFTKKDNEGNLIECFVEVKPTENQEIHNLFRGKSSSKPSAHVYLDDFSLPTTTRPTYDMDWDKFNELINPDVPTVYLISTISGEIIASNRDRSTKDNAMYMVPYSGPDQTKCKRENGQIKWCGELIDFTQ